MTLVESSRHTGFGHGYLDWSPIAKEGEHDQV